MRKLTLSLAVMAALLPVRGYSLGLGDLELHSALNQELNAEIEVLSAASEDAEQIIIKLADRDAFNRAGLDRPFLLQQLKFKIIDKNGVPYVKVYTKAPVSEPYLSFLLEIDWPQGHLLREYTLLLDPPVYNNNTSGAAAASDSSPFEEPADTQAQTQPVYSEQQNAQASHSGAQVQTAAISSDSGRSVNYQYQSLPVATATADQYRVQQNDTLWSIANRMRPDSSISVEQMMLALVRKNPEAFIRENTNGVKRGYILRTPDREEITQLDRQQAVAQAREHAALWREYSRSAASSTPASSMEMDAMEGGTAAEQPRDADGHLSIVSAGEGAESSGANQDPDAQLSKLRQDLALANEQLESERLEKEDLRSRLAELEQRVKSVIEGGGVEMNDSELAKLQADLQSSQQAPAEPDMPAEQAQPDEMVDEMSDEASGAMMDEPVTDEMAADDMASEDMAADGMAAEGEEPSMDAPAEDTVFVDEQPAGEMSDDEMMDEPAAEIEPAQPPVKAIETPAFAQQQPKGFLESLMDDPKLLGIIGGGVAFILLLVALLLKRMRASKAEEDEWTAGMSDPSLDGEGGLGAENDFSNISGSELENEALKTGEMDLTKTTEMSFGEDDDDTTRVKMPPTGETLEEAVFNLDQAKSDSEDDDRDDVIAEADVYLAYGIYQQAEELLNKAIDQNPERDDYRLKLLETHYAAKDAAAFEQLAEDVHTRKGNDKSYWDRVVTMGMELSPTNSLFSGAGAAIGDLDANALLPDTPTTTDLDLDAGGDENDFDLGLDSDSGEAELDDTELDSGLDDMDLSGMEDTHINVEPENLEADTELDLDTDLSGDLAGDLANITSEFNSTDIDTSVAEDNTATDLEFDLGEMDDTAASDDSAESEDMDIDDDFSLDFDAADLGFEEAEEETEEVALDADLDLGDALEDDLSEESVEIDLSEDLGSASDDSGDDIGDIDLGSADELDLNDVDAGDDEEFDISELSEDVDEVSTKLDLARAYIDMGDKDGARSILEEVKSEGNDEQQQQAEALIQQAS